MDKEQLKQIKYLKNEIKMLKNQITELDYTSTTDTVTGSDASFPYTFHSIKIRGIDYQGYINKLNRYQRRLERRVEELIDLLEETTDYIDNIDDSQIRQIITLRYVNGLEWGQVAAKMGGNNTADGVRMIHNRYLERK